MFFELTDSADERSITINTANIVRFVGMPNEGTVIYLIDGNSIRVIEDYNFIKEKLPVVDSRMG